MKYSAAQRSRFASSPLADLTQPPLTQSTIQPSDQPQIIPLSSCSHRSVAKNHETYIGKCLLAINKTKPKFIDTQSTVLKRQIEELERRVEIAVAHSAEVESGIARSVEDGVRSARDEVTAAQQRLEQQAAAMAEAESALASVRADLEKARRELKQRGQLARNLLAEKDAEINRLRSGGLGVSAGGGAWAGDVEGRVNGEAPGGGRVSPGTVDSAVSLPTGGGGGGGSGGSGGGGRHRAGSYGSQQEGGGSEDAALNGRSSGSAGGPGNSGADERTSPGYGGTADGGGAPSKHHSTMVQQQTAAESHRAEQQILQMARVQAQRDEETSRLRVKIQRLSDEIRAREDRLSERDGEKDELRRRVEELQGEAARAKELLDQEHGAEKMTYLKNVVKKFVMSDGSERQRLVPVVATILSFSPAELSEVDRAVAAAAAGGGSWGSVFGV